MIAPNRPPANKGKRLPPEPLSVDEFRALLKGCNSKAPTGARNAALLTVLCRAGLRNAEALALYPKDLDPAAGSLRVLHGKGDRARLAGMDPEAWAILLVWLDHRKRLGIHGNRPLFCTLKGRPLNASYVRNLLPRLGRKGGIEKRVHPHGLRHSCAFGLANEGKPLHVIQQQLGHENISTTHRYINHIAPTAVIDAMRARTWSPQ